MEPLILKLLLLSLMFILTAIAGIGPTQLLKYLRKKAAVIPLENDTRMHMLCSRLLCLLTCFSGGVFLSTCFLHLLPELNEQLRRMHDEHHYEWDYPVAELLSCAGFFLLFFAEELVMLITPSASHDESHHSGEPLLTTPAGPPRSNWVVSEPERCEVNCDRVKEDPPILMKSRPHAHSHGIRSVTLMLALSLHSIIEGVALGVQENPGEIWAIFISLLVHKLIVAFSVGLQLSRTHAHSLRWVACSIVLLAAMTPIGGLAGALIQAVPHIDSLLRDWIVLVAQGLAVGTFLYVTFFEVLIHERDNEHPPMLKLLLMVIGFSLIGLLRLVCHSHSHGVGEEHLSSDLHHPRH